MRVYYDNVIASALVTGDLKPAEQTALSEIEAALARGIIIVDEALFLDLKALGLKEADARHFMYAASNQCDRFLTLDPDFIDRRVALQQRCPSLQVVRLSGRTICCPYNSAMPESSECGATRNVRLGGENGRRC